MEYVLIVLWIVAIGVGVWYFWDGKTISIRKMDDDGEASR